MGRADPLDRGHPVAALSAAHGQHQAIAPGHLHNLLDAYDYCAERDIGNYGGGQFELGAGRGHIQYLASLFHPDAPNDVAPSGFNLAQAQPGLPSSPLAPRPAEVGFAWG